MKAEGDSLPSADVARLQYGYDRASNRLWQADTVAQAAGKDFDELVTYDFLYRMSDRSSREALHQ